MANVPRALELGLDPGGVVDLGKKLVTVHQDHKTSFEYKAFLCEAYKLARFSPDPSTQIGAFLVAYDGQSEWLTQSYNRPVNGWTMTEADWERPRKYALVEHAERGVLYNAALYNICTSGGTLVASWGCCADCSRGLVASGITTLVRHYPPADDASARWLESVALGDEIMKQGGITIIDVTGPIPGAPSILRGGTLWNPAA